jgi:hypothetical protein
LLLSWRRTLTSEGGEKKANFDTIGDFLEVAKAKRREARFDSEVVSCELMWLCNTGLPRLAS